LYREVSADLVLLLEQNPEHKGRFSAQTVPAVGAMITFHKLGRDLPAYTYGKRR
jgi:hypothetical protein